MDTLDELRQLPLFSWLTWEGITTMASCFDLRTEHLNAGSVCPTGKQVGCLLRGSAVFESGGTFQTLKPGDLIALGPQRQALTGTLTAGEDCAAVWFHRDLVRHVCYGACWFHARLIREIDRALQ